MKIAVLVDGGYLRASAKNAGKTYDNAFIAGFANSCVTADEYLLRIFYYDAPQYRGTVQLPVSGEQKTFQANDSWLRDLAKLDRFAVRYGTIGFRGWKPRSIPLTGEALVDGDFVPVFEQKGVDMRIGLDIASFSEKRTIDRIILVSGDTDMVAAMKHARKAGLEVGIVQMAPPTRPVHDMLQAHSDFVRPVDWPH